MRLSPAGDLWDRGIDIAHTSKVLYLNGETFGYVPTNLAHSFLKVAPVALYLSYSGLPCSLSELTAEAREKPQAESHRCL